MPFLPSSSVLRRAAFAFGLLGTAAGALALRHNAAQAARTGGSARCEDAAALQSVEASVGDLDLYGRRFRVLKAYDVRAYPDAGTGAAARTLLAIIRQAFAGEGVPAQPGAAFVPACTANVMTNLGDHRFGYRWHEVEGETFIEVRRWDD